MPLLEIIARRSRLDPAHFSLPDLLAEQALARVSLGPNHRFSQMITECLAAELLRDTPDAAVTYCQELLDHGVSDDLLLNTFIAGAADHLGRAWENDDLSFSQVTHAMGQLMEVARHVMFAPAAEPFMCPNRPRVLLMRPPGEEHVLGLLLSAQGMRHAGWLVRLDLSGDIATLAATTGAQDFDMIGLSVACPTRMKDLRRTIDAARMAQPKARIVVGGGLLTDHSELAKSAGADLMLSRGPDMLRRISQAFDFPEPQHKTSQSSLMDDNKPRQGAG